MNKIYIINQYRKFKPIIITAIMVMIFLGNICWSIYVHENIHVAQSKAYGCESKISINILDLTIKASIISCPDGIDYIELDKLTAQAENTYVDLHNSYLLGGILAVLVGMFLYKIK